MPTVPNQRTITVNKEKTDKSHRYTANNLDALDEAARRLQSKGGFKLYMYLAKNQNNYSFALSSADFCAWSGLGITAYNSAFEELREQGYSKLISEIKNGVNLIEEWNLEDIQKAIDVIAELGLTSYPNNNPRLCK